MKTMIGLLLISLCLFAVDSGSACEDGEWVDYIHDNHDPEKYPNHSHDGDVGEGQHRHARDHKRCPDGTTLINPNFGPLHRSTGDGYQIEDALEDFVEDTPGIDFGDPDDPPPPKTPPPESINTPQPPIIEVEEILPFRIDEEPRTDAQIDETGGINRVPGDTKTPELLAQPDGTPQNPTQNPTQNPVQTTGPPQTGVTPQPIQTQARQQTQVTQQPLRLTEYMVRDWSRTSGGNLPQWIELYNPNSTPILLHNCFFSYVAHQNFNNKTFKHVRVDNFTVPGEKAVIFVTHTVHPNRFDGVTEDQVYDLKIGNVLKRGWALRTANGGVISKAGEDFGGSRPVAPKHVNGERQSYTRYAEADTDTDYYYGAAGDIGTPGYHKPFVPQAPHLLRKQIGLWGSLKQSEK